MANDRKVTLSLNMAKRSHLKNMMHVYKKNRLVSCVYWADNGTIMKR